MKPFRSARFLLLLLMCLSLGHAAQCRPHDPLTKPIKDSLKKEIELMLYSDQHYRQMIQFGETDEQKIAEIMKMGDMDQLKRTKDVMSNKVGIPKQIKDSLWQIQAGIDSLNTVKIFGIVCRYGYPKKYVDVYKVTAIFMHAPLSFQDDAFFTVLMQEVKDGDMPGLEYATLYDRARENKKMPELFYVGEWYDAATNTSHIHTPKDLEATNKAREEIGLKKIKL